MAQQPLPNIAPPPDEYNSRGRGASMQPSATMRNHSTSNVTELRWKAAQWRKHVAGPGSGDFLELMQRAAAELETEADRLEGHAPLTGQREHKLLAS
jgi:hypothetical protein